MKPAQPGFEAALREARLAEAAHLEAVARSQDAGALRLDHLRSRLLDSLPLESTLRQSMELRLPPDFAPRLFLDLVRSVAIASDGRSYVLEVDEGDRLASIVTAVSAEDMASNILRLEAHKAIDAARRTAVPRLLRRTALHSLTPLQIALVWLSGFLVGAVLLWFLALSL